MKIHNWTTIHDLIAHTVNYSAKSLPDILSGILNQDGQYILVALTAETTLINLDSKYHELPDVTKNTQPSVYDSKIDPKQLTRTLNQIKFHLIETLDEEIHTISQVSHLIDKINHADDAQINTTEEKIITPGGPEPKFNISYV